ncbi:hypothetical protein ACJJTC_017486 [Scirpophaga incertulas]
MCELSEGEVETPGARNFSAQYHIYQLYGHAAGNNAAAPRCVSITTRILNESTPRTKDTQTLHPVCYLANLVTQVGSKVPLLQAVLQAPPGYPREPNQLVGMPPHWISSRYPRAALIAITRCGRRKVATYWRFKASAHTGAPSSATDRIMPIYKTPVGFGRAADFGE